MGGLAKKRNSTSEKRNSTHPLLNCSVTCFRLLNNLDFLGFHILGFLEPHYCCIKMSFDGNDFRLEDTLRDMCNTGGISRGGRD